jgi:hypothetical protein
MDIGTNGLLIAGIAALLATQINAFHKSKKPIKFSYQYQWNIMTPEQRKIAEADERDSLRIYKKDKFQYYGAFLTPIIFTVLSLTSVLDFYFGFFMFCVAVISTVLMAILIKIYDIGNKFYGQVP